MKKAEMRINNISQFLIPFLLLVLLAPQVSAQTPRHTLTFTGELRRLQALPPTAAAPADNVLTGEGTEAPAGQIDIPRDGTVYLGFYVKIDETNPPGGTGSTRLGASSLSGEILFSGLTAAQFTQLLGMDDDNRGAWQFYRGPDAATFSGTRVEQLSFASVSTTDNNGRLGYSVNSAFDPGQIAGTSAFCDADNFSCTILLGVVAVPFSAVTGNGGTLTVTWEVFTAAESPPTTAIANPVGTHTMNSVTYNICDAAGCPSSAGFAEASYDVMEGGTVQVIPRLTVALTNEVTVDLDIPTGLTGPASVTFPATMTDAPAITIMAADVPGDATDANESRALTLGYDSTSVSGITAIESSTATTINVIDDDVPDVTVAFGMSAYNVNEGSTDVASGGAEVEVTLTIQGSTGTTPERALTIPITTTLGGGATASDFSGVPANVTFAANASGNDLTQRFTITRADNTAEDNGKSVALGFGTPTLTPPPTGVLGTVTRTSTATVQLLNNDGRSITLMVDESDLDESDGATTIMVTATAMPAVTTDTTVTLTLAGTATSGTDYADPGTLASIMISANQTQGTASISLDPTADTILEGPETIIIMGAASGFATAMVPITLNDESTATLSIAAPSPAAVDEGMAAEFTVTLSENITGGDVSVAWTAAGSGTSAAEAADLSPVSGTVAFTAGNTSQTLSVMLVRDRVAEMNEMFTVTLGDRSGSLSGNVTLATATAMATINDADNIVLSLEGSARVNRGMTETYTVRLDDGVMVGSVDLTVTVMATTDAVEATNDAENDDYNFDITPEDDAAVMITVTIPTGASSGTFDVEFPMRTPGTGDQMQEQGDETLVLALMTPMGGGGTMAPAVNSENGSITITITEGLTPDEAAEVVTGTLLGVGRIVSSNMLGAIDARASASLAGGPSRVTLAGKTFSEDMVRSLFSNQYQDQDGDHSNHELLSNLKDLLGIRLDESNGVSLQPVSVRELLANSSFELSLNGKKKKRRGTAAPGNTLSFWGRGAYGEYESQSDLDNVTVDIDGDTLSGQLGIDYRFGEWLTGVALNYTDGSSDFTDGRTTNGAIDTKLYSVHPYVHYSPANSPLASWLMLGWGRGDVDYSDGNRSGDGDIDMLMLAAGLTYKLASTNNIDWSLKTNGFFAEFDVDEINNEQGNALVAEHKADVTQLRMAVSAGISNDLGGGDKFNANFDVGGRFDGGDAEEGAGAEIAGGLNYVSGSAGVDLAAEGRFLVAHEESGFDEWGASVSLRFDPGIRKHGFQLSMLPAWGNSSSSVDTLYESKGASDSVLQHSDNDDPEMRMETRIAYGFPILRDDNLLTPYVEMENASQRSSLRLGKSLEIMTLKGMSFKSDVYGTQESHTGDRGFVLDSRLERSFARDFATLSLFGKLQSGDIAEDEDYQIGVELNSKF